MLKTIKQWLDGGVISESPAKYGDEFAEKAFAEGFDCNGRIQPVIQLTRQQLASLLSTAHAQGAVDALADLMGERR